LGLVVIHHNLPYAALRGDIPQHMAFTISREKFRKPATLLMRRIRRVGPTGRNDAASLMPDQPTGISGPDNSPYRAKPPDSGQGLERPILYISRATLPYETRYEALELEMACLAWAVGRLRQYLDGSPFKVFTDPSAIPGILWSSANTSYSLRLDKFRMQLMPFIDNMDIIHQPGKSLPHVDCLSRNIGLGTSPKDSAGGMMGNGPTVRETIDGG